MRVENGAVAEHTVGFEVETSRVDPAQRHATGYRIILAIDHATGRLVAETFGRKSLELLVRQLQREQRPLLDLRDRADRRETELQDRQSNDDAKFT